jgi:hypothetical protein
MSNQPPRIKRGLVASLVVAALLAVAFLAIIDGLNNGYLLAFGLLWLLSGFCVPENPRCGWKAPVDVRNEFSNVAAIQIQDRNSCGLASMKMASRQPSSLAGDTQKLD